MGSVRAASAAACFAIASGSTGSFVVGTDQAQQTDRWALLGRADRLAHRTPALQGNQPRITKLYAPKG